MGGRSVGREGGRGRGGERGRGWGGRVGGEESGDSVKYCSCCFNITVVYSNIVQFASISRCMEHKLIFAATMHTSKCHTCNCYRGTPEWVTLQHTSCLDKGAIITEHRK